MYDRRAEERAREHPIRAKILDLYAQDEDRSLAVADVLQDLEGCTDLRAVAYHINVLKGAVLLPKDD
jgi:hypothetical protein